MTEEQRVALEAIRHELQYRRDKQWKIFSWTATLLLAAIAGVITLVGREEFVFSLWPQQAMMTIALCVIGVYACLWIQENIEIEGHARNALLGKLKNEGLKDDVVPDPRCAPIRGYSATIVLLMIAAVLTVLSAPVTEVTYSQQSGSASGSQSVHTETDRPSSADGSRR